MLIMRFFATLGLTLWLVGSVSFQVAAQGNETGTEETVDDGSGNGTGNSTGNSTGESTEEPVETQEEEPAATGTLSVLVFVCTSGGDPETGAIFLEGDFSPDDSCTPGSASVAIDGGEATGVDGSADFTLDAGIHSIAETTTAARKVEVVADGTTTVTVVAYAAPEAQALPETTIRLIKHDCVPSIQTKSDFDALESNARLVACPAIVRPDETGSDGAVAGDPADFDFSFVVGEDEPLTLAGVAPTPDQICEDADELNTDVDGDGALSTCFDASYYAVTIQGGPVTITETTVPEKHRFGAADLPDENDALALVADSIDDDAGHFAVDPSLDASGDGVLVVHVYNFSPPRVAVVVRSCPDGVKVTADLATDLEDCPAITQDGTPGLDVTLKDKDGQEQAIANAPFEEKLVCDGDQCLAGYAFDGVAQGSVTVKETAPDGLIFDSAVVESDSLTADVEPVALKVKDGVVTLDTTDDGNVTVHLFNVAAPDSGGGGDTGGDTGGNGTTGNSTGGDSGGNETSGNNTGGDTGGGGDDDGGSNTGGGGDHTGGDGSANGNDGESSGVTGSVEIYMLYCLADSDYLDMEVLDPGQEVDPYSFGDDTCLQDVNEFQITLHSRDDLDPFDVGYDGYELVGGLPVTAGDDPHLITDTLSGTSVPFEVEADTVTEVVVLVWECCPGGDFTDEDYSNQGEFYYPADEDQFANDEEAVQDGEDLPDTGTAMASSGSDGTVLLLFGLGCFFALGGAYRFRRTRLR